MKKYLLLSLLIPALLSATTAKEENDRDMVISLSDKRFSISDSNYLNMEGFDARIGRVSDFGKIAISYGEVSSSEYQYKNYDIGIDAYVLKHKWLNLSLGTFVGVGNMKNKVTNVEKEVLTAGLGAQADLLFSKEIALFVRAGYLKNWELEPCNENSEPGKCFDSKELKNLDDFNTRSIMMGVSYYF